jgi:hypothetical protein
MVGCGSGHALTLWALGGVTMILSARGLWSLRRGGTHH